MSKQIKIGEKHSITLDVNTSNPDKYWFIDPEIVKQLEWQLKREILIQKILSE